MKAITKALFTITTLVLFLGVNLVSAETFVQSYYKNNPTSLETLEAKWGNPVSVKAIGDDIEMRVYGEKDVEIGYNYFIVKDGIVKDRGVTKSIGKKPIEAKGPKFSGWMPEFYKTTHRTVEQMVAKFGEPVQATTYPNGMERIVFGPIEQGMYGFVIVLNGRVLDAGPTELQAVHNDKEELKVSPFMTNWYKKHPKSVAFVTEKWGKPVSVRDYKNGMKRMVFGPKDAELGYQFFITKDGQVIDRGVTNSDS